jgi:excisionase family DNA binding protein
MTDLMNRPLTINEAANALGLSAHTIRAWISQRRLAHVRLGRAIRVLPSTVETMLRNGTVEAAQDSPHDQRKKAACNFIIPHSPIWQVQGRP